jgi:hypothetical protein
VTLKKPANTKKPETGGRFLRDAKTRRLKQVEKPTAEVAPAQQPAAETGQELEPDQNHAEITDKEGN